MHNIADLIINEPEIVIIATLEQAAQQDSINLSYLNSIDKFGFCPLIEAVISRKIKVLTYLLDHGALVDQTDILGRTALQWAVERVELAACKILLERGADPNHFSLDGQTILVYPILRGQLELVALLQKFKADHLFAQDFISAKLLGHRFELSGETDIFSPNKKFVPLSFEGFYLEFTVGLIARSLNDFMHAIPGQKFKAFQPKLQLVLEALNNAAVLESFAQHKDKSLFKPTIDRILQSSLLLIPSAYSGHAITFIKYKDFLAKCDRGVSNLTDTVIIYKIGNPYLSNRELWYKLLYEAKTDHFINYEIKEYLSLIPIKSLPTRSQIAGNCSFANVETSVPAMLYLLFEVNSPREVMSVEKNVYGFYKNWIEWDKDSALDEAIYDFNHASLERQLSKAMILGSILIQRCISAEKKHIERAKKILSILVLPQFQFILRNYISTYNKSSAGQVGKNFINLLEKAGLTKEEFNNIVLQHPVKVKFKHDQNSNNLVKMTTALHIACLENNLTMVRHLLSNLKMDVNYLDRTGSTALMYAAWKGHMPLVKMLILDYKADPKIKNFKNGTAEKYAKHAGWDKIVKFLHDFTTKNKA